MTRIHAPRTLVLAAAVMAILSGSVVGTVASASAQTTTADPAPAVPAGTSSPATPSPTTPGTTTPGAVPAPSTTAGKGCAGVAPQKPWRLVASRPDAQSADVKVEWSAVGCTSGYRVDITATGVTRRVDVVGGSTSSVVVPGLAPQLSYRITVTSIGASGAGGVSGVFVLHRSGSATAAELTIDFPDAGPSTPVPPSASGTGPWVNPELRWTAPAGSAPSAYRLKVTGTAGTVVERTLPGAATSAHLGDAVAAGLAYIATLTPVHADGSDGTSMRLAFGDQEAPRPEQVTGNAPVVQFSPAADPDEGRVLGYEVAYGSAQATTHVFLAAPTGSGAPWIAFDPTFAAVDGADRTLPLRKLVVIVRTIATTGRSGWTPVQTLTYSDVATPDAAYYAGIGHVANGQTVPRTGVLHVQGSSADVQVSDLIWSQSGHGQAVTVAVFGPGGSAAPAFTQELPATHLVDLAQDAWRISSLPLPDGWTSIVLRRGGVDVARWVHSGSRACVAAVSYSDAPTDLPDLWKDSWCRA